MPGSFVFRPIEANLTHNTDFIKKMDPYCAFIINNRRINGEVCRKGGKTPHWSEPITVPAPTKQQKMVVEVMDKDRITKDDQIGSFIVDLQEIKSMGQVSKWYPVFYKNKPAGQILMQSSYGDNLQGNYMGQSGSQFGSQSAFVGGAGAAGYGSSLYGQPGYTGQPTNYGQSGMTQGGYMQKGGMSQSQPVGGLDPNRFIVEQRQSVQPHTFVKEIDVTETQPVLRQVQVYEPRTVVKDVQYTELVPVTKQVETVTPQKVTKEIQVMEPRLVTKTIEVIEQVPVKKLVEVVESVPVQREVETYEQQTFTKEIEVTEQVPVMKTVTVVEPVHLKKAVEFMEPIITTQTITKEVIPEVTVNQEITTSVGPATLKEVQTTERVLTERIGQMNISEQERWRTQEVYSGQKWTEEERRLNEQRIIEGGLGSGVNNVREERYFENKPIVSQSQEAYTTTSSHYNMGKTENLGDFYSKFSRENRDTLQNKF